MAKYGDVGYATATGKFAERFHSVIKKNIPVAIPDLTGNEEQYLLDAFRSSWISSAGAYIDRFEKDFSAMTSTEFTLGVCNGTVALHLALLGLGVKPGDEIIVPSFTFIATVNAVTYVGATPVFVDIDSANWCISPACIEAAITSRTKGIIAVDLYGHPADYDAINAIARKHGLWVVEDAAEAHGALYKSRPAGGLADVGTFSFFGNKIITSGEGGAVVCNNPGLHARFIMLRGQGVDPSRRYYFPIIGHNFRITNLVCSLLCAQLERQAEIIQTRCEIFARYDRNLCGVAGLHFQPVSGWAVPAPWLYCLCVDSKTYGHSRDELMKYLSEKGVDTRPFFIPIHALPPYYEMALRQGVQLPVTEKVAAAGLNLPTYGSLPMDDVDFICEQIIAFGRS